MGEINLGDASSLIEVACTAAKDEERLALGLLLGGFFGLATRTAINEHSSSQRIVVATEAFLKSGASALYNTRSYWRDAPKVLFRGNGANLLGKLHNVQQEAATFAGFLRQRFERNPLTRSPFHGGRVDNRRYDGAVIEAASNSAKGDQRTALALLLGAYLELATRIAINEHPSSRQIATTEAFLHGGADALWREAKSILEHAGANLLPNVQLAEATLAARLCTRFEQNRLTRPPRREGLDADEDDDSVVDNFAIESPGEIWD